MRRYISIQLETGFVDFQNTKPKPLHTWYAYKNGQATEHPTEDDARKVSNLVEKIVTNKAELAEWHSKNDELTSKCREIFDNELREEYSYLSDEIFSVCYEEAYDRGHSYGHDSVAEYMQSVVSFAEKILKYALT